MTQALKDFCEEQRTEINKFEAYWLAKNKEDPETFPMIMKEGNEGLWWEMLQDFSSPWAE